ncbi:MAG: protein-L-isoaspartate(D-aspartate) O-methyltransferase, partial [Burkholderiaceae bacterium]
MTDKGKRFPLTLSSLQNKSARGGAGYVAPRVETPQTATRNAAGHVTPVVRTAEAQERRAAGLPQRLQPLVSDCVRRAMVMRLSAQGIKDTMVLAAMEAVQRHLFIEPGLVAQAYVNASIPIGYHQTISKPYIVARMIEVLRNGGALNRVLEIGTGCG